MSQISEQQLNADNRDASGSPSSSDAEERPLSRQRRWQLAREAKGLCYICGAPLGVYARRCDDCELKQNELKRKSRGSKKRYTRRSER